MLIKDVMLGVSEVKKCKGTNAKQLLLKSLFRNNKGRYYKKLLAFTYDKTKIYGLQDFKKTGYVFTYKDENIGCQDIFEMLSTFEGNRSLKHDLIEEWFDEVFYHAPEEEVNFVQCIFKRSLDIGLNVKGINKAYKEVFGCDLIPTFDVMLAQSFNEKKLEFPCFIEPKYDGIRMIIKVKGGHEEPYTKRSIDLFSRSGQDLNAKFPDIIEMVRSITDASSNFVMDCEVVPVDGNFQQLMTRMTKNQTENSIDVKVMIFDCLTVEEFDKQSCTRNIRKRTNVLFKFLKELNHPQLVAIKRYKVGNEEEYTSLYKKICKEGYEGIIIKPLKGDKGLYEFKRSYNWMKKKPVFDVDLKVTGVKEGKNKNKGKVGTLTVGHNGFELNVSGMREDERELWWKEPELIIGKIVEIEYQEETDDGKLRFLQFKRVRYDK